MNIETRRTSWQDLASFLRDESGVQHVGDVLSAGLRTSEVGIITSADVLASIPELVIRLCRIHGLRLLGFDQPAQESFRFLVARCDRGVPLEFLYVNAEAHPPATRQASLRGLMQDARRRWYRIRHVSGVFIAILGPDGSGKTSVLDAIVREFEDTMPDPLLIHFRPKFGAPQNLNEKSRNPHGRRPRGLLRSLLKVAFYAYDEIVGYFRLIRPHLVRNQMVVFDRYFHDLLVDPIRYRYGGPAWAVELLDRLVPKPDILVVMDAPASIIQARVSEVALEETRRQCVAYRNLGRRYSFVRLIDASRDPLDVAHQARAVVLDYLEGAASERLARLAGRATRKGQERTQPALAA